MNSNSQTNLTIGIVVATLVAAAGTYFAFDYLSRSDKAPAPVAEPAAAPAEPMTPGEAAVAAGTPDDPYGAAVQDAATRAADTGSDTDSNAAISAATEAAVAAVGGEGTGLTAEDARRIGEEVARQVAAQVAQQIVDQQLSSSAASGSGGGLTAEEARRIGEEEGRRVAQEVAQAALANLPSGSGGGGLSAAEAEQIGLAAGRRAARQVAADTARDVVRNEFGGSVQTAASASSGEASPSPSSPSDGASAPARIEKPTPAPDALTAWWPGSNGGFGLVYAGQPKGEQAIALLFSGEPSTDALNQSVKVYDAKGNLVGGSWEAASNPRLAVLRGLQPGRYTVVLEGSLADGQGQSLGRRLHGPVYVI